MNEEPKTTMGEWPRPEEVMPPRPTQEQDALWDYLDTVFDEDTLNRESKFINLDDETQGWLASISLAQSIGKLGGKYLLVPDQIVGLARVIRYFFIGEIARENLTSALETAVKVDTQKAAALGADPDFKNLLRLEEAPSPPPEIKPTPQIQEALPVQTPPKPAESSGDEPFLLHEEKPLFTPSGPKEAPSVSFEPRRREWPAAPPKPVAAKIETPSTEEEENKKRVVHYSNLRTPLDTDAKDAK